MAGEMMDIQELAAYLKRDSREVSRLVDRGQLPAHKVAGQWRFSRAEVSHWLEGQLAGYDDRQLTDLEGPGAADVSSLVVTSLLAPESVATPLAGRTRASVLKELVELAGRTWQVYDPGAVLAAVRQREELLSTALECGAAIPHPRRPLPTSLGDSVLAYGRTTSAIPFGAPGGALTDMFFLVCCRDDRTHLRVLARLSRLLLRPGFVHDLRQAERAADSMRVIAAAEAELGTS